MNLSACVSRFGTKGPDIWDQEDGGSKGERETERGRREEEQSRGWQVTAREVRQQPKGLHATFNNGRCSRGQIAQGHHILGE